jgi:hypothetical protein
VDDCRFDNWTRMVAGKSDRRTAVMGLAGGAAALLTLVRAELGIAQESGVDLEAECRDNGDRCRRDNNCCSLNCKLRRNRRGGGRNRRSRRGKCQCSGAGERCQRDLGCCAGICRNGNCDCGDDGDFCGDDNDCCARRCDNGRCRCARRNDRCDNDRACCSGRCSFGACT